MGAEHRMDAERLYALYLRITQENDGKTYGMARPGDWLGCVEGYLEAVEEMAEDLLAARRAVRLWIIEHASLSAVDLQSLATAVGIELPVREVRDHRDHMPRSYDDSQDRAPDSRRLDRA